MAKSIAKPPKRDRVDTEDRIMESVASATMWAERHRRVAMTGLIALVAAGAAGVVYVRYKADLHQRAAVGLDELRLSTQGAAPEALRQELGVFIERFASTSEANEARLHLAELEMRRDSIEAAIQTLEPVISGGTGTPIGYHALAMLAVAQERKGDTGSALRTYQRLNSEARHDYQRRAASASEARLHEFSGEYAEADRIYAVLAADKDASADAAFYAVRLGEVRARAEAQLPPPAVPVIAPLAAPDSDDGGTEASRPVAEESAGEE